MSGSHTMLENNDSSDFYELVSDVKDEFVNSDAEGEITFGGPQKEQEQHKRNSNLKVEVDEFNRDTFEGESVCVGDEVDIKYEVNDIEDNYTPEAGYDHDELEFNPRPIESNKFEKEELNQLYSDLFLCERDCETCQKYIRKLSQHVRVTHAADQPTHDPLHIDPRDMNQSAANEIKTEIDEDHEGMDCSKGSDSNSVSDPDGESVSDSDPIYNTSHEFPRKRKSGRKVGKDNKPAKSSGNDHMVCQSRTSNAEKPFKCEVCGLGFTKNSVLTIHLRTHNGEKPFKCNECVKAFARKEYLITHMRIHTGEKPHKCEECSKDFATRKDLTVHMRIHTQEIPYKCEECAKSFTTKSNLTVHLRGHSGTKLFKCEVCSKCYTRNINLKVHRMVHSGEIPYKCEGCGKGFKRADNLDSHIKSHNDARPYKCEVCGKDFKSADYLHKHNKNHSRSNL